MIYNENAEGKIGKLTVEYVKDTFENYYSSHSFGVNPGAICGGSNILLGIPGIRNQKEFSVHESHVESGMHIKENHVVIGEKITIKPELENHEHLHIFDTAPISSIGSIMAGVQEIKENWEAIQKPHHHDIIIDAEPVDVVQEHKEEKKPVIADDAEPRTHEKREDFSLKQDEIHEVLDEIYYEDIAPYHEFERAGSPDRVETELTRAVGKVQDVASGLANASVFSNMPEPIIGADSDPQSMVALGKGVMKVAEFAGEIFGTVIEPAANAIGTKVRRVLRDDLSISQAKAQDIGDITHVVAGILIPGGAAKVISKTGKLTSFGKATKEATALDKVNKVPYNPKKAQHLASELLFTSEFDRTTVPCQSMPNVRLAGQCKERIVGTDPVTFEPIVQRVTFDNRGFPIFDPYVKVEIRITGDLANMSREAHMRAATRQLRNDIKIGKVDKSMFSEIELKDIGSGKEKIGQYTWHHHQETGRMQLVPTGIHEWIKHVGGNQLWRMKK